MVEYEEYRLLEESYYGSIRIIGVYFWFDSICKGGPINKNLKRKRNVGKRLQRVTVSSIVIITNCMTYVQIR